MCVLCCIVVVWGVVCVVCVVVVVRCGVVMYGMSCVVAHLDLLIDVNVIDVCVVYGFDCCDRRFGFVL